MPGPLEIVPGADDAVCVDGVCALPSATAEETPVPDESAAPDAK